MGMLLQYHRQAAEAAETEAKPLSKQNLEQLQETARAAGLSDEGSKAELRDRIREHAGNDNPPATDPEDDTEAEDSTESEDAEDDTPGE